MLPFFMRKSAPKYKPEKHEKYPKKGQMAIRRVLVLIQVVVASLRRRQAHASVRTNKPKSDNESTSGKGEVAANPLGDLSPFSPPCVDFHFTPSLFRLHFRSSRERLRFLLRRYCGNIPSLKTAECCKTIVVPQATSFQCSAHRLWLFYIAFS